jgi:hypothetical protein
MFSITNVVISFMIGSCSCLVLWIVILEKLTNFCNSTDKFLTNFCNSTNKFLPTNRVVQVLKVQSLKCLLNCWTLRFLKLFPMWPTTTDNFCNRLMLVNSTRLPKSVIFHVKFLFDLTFYVFNKSLKTHSYFLRVLKYSTHMKLISLYSYATYLLFYDCYGKFGQ